MKKRWIITLLILLLCGISTLYGWTAPFTYRIGPGDVLSFDVFHHPEFHQEQLLIRSDGTATFQGIGQLSVAGKTLDELQERVEEQVKTLIKNPTVLLTLKQSKPGTVYLSGAVVHPGMHQLVTQPPGEGGKSTDGLARTDFRLSNILAQAGGVLLNADLSQVRVKHPDGTETEPLNLWKVLKEGNSQADAWIQSGDTVNVPALANGAFNDEETELILRSPLGPKTFPVRVIGQVTHPGVYELEGNSPYLNSAISKAGGFNPGAKQQRVAIRRFSSDHQMSTFWVNPQQTDLILRPNDVVVINEQKVYRSARGADQFAKVLSPLTSLGSTAFSFAWITGLGGFNK